MASYIAAVHTCGELTNSLHGVSLLDQELGSGDVNVHAERLLLFVNWLCWTCVFTGEYKTKRELNYQKPIVMNSPQMTVLCAYRDTCPDNG